MRTPWFDQRRAQRGAQDAVAERTAVPRRKPRDERRSPEQSFTLRHQIKDLQALGENFDCPLSAIPSSLSAIRRGLGLAMVPDRSVFLAYEFDQRIAW